MIQEKFKTLAGAKRRAKEIVDSGCELDSSSLQIIHVTVATGASIDR